MVYKTIKLVDYLNQSIVYLIFSKFFVCVFEKFASARSDWLGYIFIPLNMKFIPTQQFIHSFELGVVLFLFQLCTQCVRQNVAMPFY